MTKKQKKELIRIAIALIIFVIIKIVDVVLEKCFTTSFPYGLASLTGSIEYGYLLPLFIYLSIYLFIGYDVLIEFFVNMIHGQMLDENFLMTFATFGAFGLGIYNGITIHKPEGFDEGCAVLLFYQVGEWFESYAVNKSRKSISTLMDIRPDYANKKLANGQTEMVDPNDISIDDIIVVLPGEKIPLDGIIIKGSSTLDCRALTGESLPQEVEEGNDVISGTINLTSTLEIKVNKEFSESTVAKILDLVENATNQKSKSETFITKFARVYTPIVVFSALLLAIIPSIVCGCMNLSIDGVSGWETFTKWIYRALLFLVVSCPCALVISVPLSFFAGIGGASRNGILIKGSIHLERFNKTNIFVFDKTGTLTKGNFVIKEIFPNEKKEEILSLAATAECQSNHPIAESIKLAYQGNINPHYVNKNIAGKGIVSTYKEDIILAGNYKLMEEYHIDYPKLDKVGTLVYIAHNHQFVGYILIADEIKEGAKDLISYLNSIGAKTIMLTGDNDKIASHVAKALNIQEYQPSLLPQNKVEEVDKLLQSKGKNELLCFVGDGINDAPVLMKSDIGIAMGGVGSDAAIEASDIVLMHDDLKGIKIAKKVAKKTMTIVYENIFFALGVKLVILLLSALGYVNMWIAVFGDVGVAIIAILNAMRCNSRYKE